MSVLTAHDKKFATWLLFRWDYLCRNLGESGPAVDAASAGLHAHGILTPTEYIMGEAIEQGVI